MKISEERKFNAEKYDDYVKDYISKSEGLNNPINSSELRFFDLPDGRWFVRNCPDDSVKRWSDFVDWCGFVAKGKKPTKEKMITLIYKLQEEINRPLMYDDFRGVGCYHPPLKLILEYWGTINNMKKELGLEVIQESMIDRHLSKEDFDMMLLDICKYVKNDHRDFITTSEIDSNNQWNNSQSLRRYSKDYYNMTLTDMFLKHNIRLGKQGSGINFDFEDGEHVSSQFEYMFSKFLKDYGLKYNVDYFRDSKYSTFIPDCTNNMNCDYVIHINNKIIYIEIAGIIEPYKEWFFNNKPINSRKSREKYRLKLLEKQKMLRENNLHYYILFPCDLTYENFKSILENDSITLRKKIESFMKNNIDWSKVRKSGELKYSDDIKWGRNIINYGEAV